ncbi:MAG TPA: hypothetical protein VF131_22045 [Blastocatellia bacterium]|nr:hypothetical protein [Blastocatellia bacterium]
MKVKSNVKAGGLNLNHNQTINRKNGGLRVKSNVKAGGFRLNHNQTLIRQVE